VRCGCAGIEWCFARALVVGALEGKTSFTEAFRMPGAQENDFVSWAWAHFGSGPPKAYLLDEDLFIRTKNLH
jgi:hypothetical protein